MRTKFALPIAIVPALVAIAFAWQQWRVAKEMGQRVAVLTGQLKEHADASTAQIAHLEEANDTFTRESSSLREKLAQYEEGREKSRPVASASAPPSTVGLESSTELMRREMEDPQVRERMRRQTMSILKETYSEFAQTELTPEQSAEFFDLLAEREFSDKKDAVNFLSRSTDDSEANRNVAQSAAVEWSEKDRQLRAFLSESEYGKLQEYERTISDRIALMQIRQDLALNSQPLNEEQKKFLWQVLRDERSQIPALKYDPRNAGRMRENYRVVLESDNAARYFEAQAALDKRVLARAQTILSSEQYEALATVQRHHCELQETVVELARKALGNQAGKNAGTPPH